MKFLVIGALLGMLITPQVISHSELPYPYYQKVEQRYGYYELFKTLTPVHWDKPYQENIYDCTEMSAELERILENKGFNSKIVIGTIPNGIHAWVITEVMPDYWVIVESTTLSIAKDAELYQAEYTFNDIYEAIKINKSAFDWWK